MSISIHGSEYITARSDELRKILEALKLNRSAVTELRVSVTYDEVNVFVTSYADTRAGVLRSEYFSLYPESAGKQGLLQLQLAVMRLIGVPKDLPVLGAQFTCAIGHELPTLMMTTYLHTSAEPLPVLPAFVLRSDATSEYADGIPPHISIQNV